MESSGLVYLISIYTKNGPPWYAIFLADEKRWRVLSWAKIRLFYEITKNLTEKAINRRKYAIFCEDNE